MIVPPEGSEGTEIVEFRFLLFLKSSFGEGGQYPCLGILESWFLVLALVMVTDRQSLESLTLWSVKVWCALISKPEALVQ